MHYNPIMKVLSRFPCFPSDVVRAWGDIDGIPEGEHDRVDNPVQDDTLHRTWPRPPPHRHQ